MTDPDSCTDLDPHYFVFGSRMRHRFVSFIGCLYKGSGWIVMDTKVMQVEILFVYSIAYHVISCVLTVCAIIHYLTRVIE